MASFHHEIYTTRAWMYNRQDPETGEVTREFKEGITQFLNQAVRNVGSNAGLDDSGNVLIFCPCSKCKNYHPQNTKTVWKHLFRRGFLPNYFVWFSHGEDLVVNVPGSSSTSNYHENVESGSQDNYQYGHENYNASAYGNTDGNRFNDMVNDAFQETTASFSENSFEEPNPSAQRFYDMLDAANEPIYKGCRDGLSKLSLASRMMTIKSEENLTEHCMDKFSELFKEYLPEGNNCAESYYEIQQLVASLGLPYEVIDVCIDNCMIFWKDDVELQECRFCSHPRYKKTSGRTKVPFKRMWYLPITERLKRLYQSEETAAPMRWHAEHEREEGVVAHPSDAKAWKHFQTVHPEFAQEPRNVYLGLCTDGFSPFGLSGRKYSLWPVIVTPYNLPPEMCMHREFLFLSVLVPGPKHPKRSLDVFMQPLIHELKELWNVGVRTYDSSKRRNFNMKVVLMWTISDFPAYGMLSGWTTHGRLSCPYCLDKTDAFQLSNGRKPCWFDCHRRFLPMNHPYRKSKTLFKKRVVKSGPVVYLSGEEIEEQILGFGAEETVKVGGTWQSNPSNMPVCYGEYHNWHKKSIFWELPYWKDHLLRHNLDVMHVEKNFFENIIHTLLNVAGKTKDNHKSRLDLALLCIRLELQIQEGAKIGPIPNFRLSADGKNALYDWVQKWVKFPDGYVSSFSRCVEQGGKFSGMKSHDCHVFMQRLLPFALQELLPEEVHDAIAGIGAFFRDLCARTLSDDDITKLKSDIPLILCNLEKIFPPSFFDVMEHLPIHLPDELELGGPVHFRWMYPFERFFKHLKMKAKNLARVEGSIIAGSMTEETSNFSRYYFKQTVTTKRTRRRRYDDGGVGRTYPLPNVPNVFSDIGRMAGKVENTTWCDFKHLEAAHLYIMLNCSYFDRYERMLTEQIREGYPHLDESQVRFYLERDFPGWMRAKVSKKSNRTWPTWVQEFVQGPIGSIRKAKMYCTRGFIFHTYAHGHNKTTANWGVHIPGDTHFYGILQEIIEVEYAGVLNLRCILFRCDWYDPTPEIGVRISKFGVVDVKGNKKYTDKFEPFVLASQAEQVVFIPYPRKRERRDPTADWLSVIKVNPRGRIMGGLSVAGDQDDPPPVQPARTAGLSISVDTDNVTYPVTGELDVIFEESDGNDDEYATEEDDDDDDEDENDEDVDEGGTYYSEDEEEM